MTGLLVRRLASVVPLLFFVSIVVFSLVQIVPGDPARTLAGGQYATPELVAQVRHELGLDQPIVVQYGRWVRNAVHLDFGKSLSTNRPVLTEVTERLPVTADLVVGGVFLALVFSVPAGIASCSW